MKITSKYLIVPVNLQMRSKTIKLTDTDGKLVFDLTAYLDAVTPQFNMYVDIERFRGMDLTISTDPETDITFEMTDTKPMDGVYSSYLRPAVHFTAAYGWLNDPNGLVYHNGTYHMFFQHNPAGPLWGNMHWGHATSPDLVHWTEGDIALFPDETGTMYSGSAIIDRNNVSGLSENGDTILLFYTAAGENSLLSAGAKFTQCLAYSKDGGKTFVKHAKNPIIPHIVGGNRDPKVIYCEELGTYLLALYLDGNDYALFESANLIDWTMIQKVVLPNDSECPDFYPLTVENAENERKWVFAGASDTYVVGHIDTEARRFVMDEEAKAYHIGRRVSYAAQTFSDTPGRRIKIAWDGMDTRNTLFCCQMGIPCEMSLVKLDNNYYMRSLPVAEFDTLAVKTDTYAGCTKAILSRDAAYDITVGAPKNADDFIISVFGMTFEVKPAENIFRYAGQDIPLSYTGGDIDIRVITDTIGVELFLDGGLIYSTETCMLDKNLNRLTVTGERADITVKELANIH